MSTVLPEAPLNQIFEQLHALAVQPPPDPEQEGLVQHDAHEVDLEAANTIAAQREATERILEQGLPWFTRWLQQLLPFVVLLVTAFLSHHFIGLFVFVWLTFVLHRANRALREQLGLWAECRLLALAQLSAALGLNMALVYLAFAPIKLWRRLLLLPTTAEEFGFWAGLFAVVVTDLMIKFGGMVFKCGLLASLRHTDLSKPKRTQWFSLVEASSLLYRTIAPVPVWVHYFSLGDGTVVSSVSTALYLTLKLALAWDRGKCLLLEGSATCRGALVYGTLVTPTAEMEDCSICQGPLCTPVELHCRHVFCEGCVGEWLERETSCPLCRAQVRTQYLDQLGPSDGGTSLLPQLF